MSANTRTNWMENHTDDAVLADLILGARRAVSSEVGPIAGRLTKDFAEHSAPVELTVRLAVACLFLAGAHISERKKGHQTPAVFSLQLWEGLASIPVSQARTVTIERSAVLLPFSAYQYASLIHRGLGNNKAADQMRDGLQEAIAAARSTPMARMVSVWAQQIEPLE